MFPFFPVSVNTRRRLIYVATRDHSYTFADLPQLLRKKGVDAKVWSYDRLYRSRHLPRATYVFSDLDRLSPTLLEVTAKLYMRIKEQGLTALNDPRGFRHRAAMLKALHKAGINRFTCHLPGAGEWPDRYPVFLRTIAAHRGIIGDLLADESAARKAMARAFTKGFPISDLVFVEYAATPDPVTKAFQKHAAYRIGPHIVRANTVNDTDWRAKNGIAGIATAAQYQAELAEYDHYPHDAFVRAVFDFAGIEFGRIDFGIVQGLPQVYEINTNPYMSVRMTHDNADRRATMAAFRAGLVRAFADITQASPGPRVSLDGLFLSRSRLLRRPANH